MGLGDHPKTYLLKALCCESTPSWLKVVWWWWWWWPRALYCHLLGLGIGELSIFHSHFPISIFPFPFPIPNSPSPSQSPVPNPRPRPSPSPSRLTISNKHITNFFRNKLQNSIRKQKVAHCKVAQNTN